MVRRGPTYSPGAKRGNRRRRRPVAAKRALATAGAMGGTPGSPMPPKGSPEGTRCTSISGVSRRERLGVVGKIPGFDPALIEADLFMEGGAKAEEDAAFHLGRDGIRVDHGATVHGADDPMDLDFSIFFVGSDSATWAT